MSILDNLKMNIKALGLNIKAERNRLNLSQMEFGALVDLSQATITAIETGRQIPSAINLYLIAKALGVTIDELFKGVE